MNSLAGHICRVDGKFADPAGRGGSHDADLMLGTLWVSAQWLLVVSPNQVLNRYRDEVYGRNPELMPRLVGPEAVPMPF